MLTAAQQDAAVHRVVASAVWIRADEIADRLGWAVSSVSASLRRLRAAKRVRSKGRTRGTVYVVVT